MEVKSRYGLSTTYDKTIDIVKMLIDIVLDSIISILKFVTFIPNFSAMIYDFVFGDESTDTEDE